MTEAETRWVVYRKDLGGLMYFHTFDDILNEIKCGSPQNVNFEKLREDVYYISVRYGSGYPTVFLALKLNERDFCENI